MGLRETAEQDLVAILEDSATGFGYAISLTNPAGATVALTGFSSDIAQLIDPDTGQAVSGRLASASLPISSILTAGLTLPQGIADAGVKPWLAQFNDINGTAHTFKVSQSNPDRALGLVTLLLEAYTP